jgi:hypothetical protein
MKDANSEKHQNTAECIKYAFKPERYLKSQQLALAEEISFKIAGVEIEQVSQFQYLGGMLDENDDDSRALHR